MLCHQLTDGEVLVKVQKPDGIHQTKLQVHQLIIHLDLIQLILVLVLLLSTITTIIIKLKILVMKESLRRSMDSLQMIRVFSHNHGEEPRKLTQRTDSRTHLGNGSNNRNITIIIKPRILEMRALLRKSMDSLQMIRAYSPNHGEELKKPTQRTDSKIHLGNGCHKRNTITTTRLRILVTKVSLKKFMVSLPLIRAYSHNHGEELRKLIQRMDSRTHLGNGSHKRNTITIIRLRILVMKVSWKRFTDSPQMTNQSSHNHGEEPRKLIQRMDSRTHLGNGFHKNFTTTIIRLWILVMKVLSRRSTDSPQMTNQSSHSHGEEPRKLIHRMDLRTLHSSGFLNKIKETLVTLELLRKSMDLLLMTRAFCHNHGEEPRKLTQLTDLRTLSSNGSISQH